MKPSIRWLLHALQQQEPAKQEQQTRGDADALAARCGRDHADHERRGEGGGLAGEGEQTEELRGLFRRRKPGKQRAARRLDGP